MREILFRGKQIDSEENDWVYGYYYVLKDALPNSSDRHVIVAEGNGNGQATVHIPVFKETVGQFTGLTDKNGVKIFEGDTIRWSEWQGTGLPNGEEELAFEDYLVEFINGMFVAKCLLSRFPTHCLLTEFDLKEGKLIDTEVVGNIHDKEV